MDISKDGHTAEELKGIHCTFDYLAELMEDNFVADPEQESRVFNSLTGWPDKDISREGSR